jgi:hypothetical protein
VLAEWRGIATSAPRAETVEALRTPATVPGAIAPAADRATSPSDTAPPAPSAITRASGASEQQPPPAPSDSPAPTPASQTPSSALATPPPASAEPSSPAAPDAPPATWRDVTLRHIEQDLTFDRLPPDAGVYTPLAEEAEPLDENTAAELSLIRMRLPQWPPGQADDPLQRARNYLFVPAVADLYQMDPLERWLGWEVYERLQAEIPQEDLIKILYWIALHPNEGSDDAVDQLRILGLGSGPQDIEDARHRAAVYAVKLLGRLTGRIPW